MSDIYQASPPPRVEVTTAKGQSFVLPNPVACETSRALENPVAQASLTFWDDIIEGTGTAVDGELFTDVIKIYDLVRIEWPARDEREWQDGLYLVQRPLQQYAVNQDGPESTFTLSLLSIGEALQRYKIFWHPWLADRNNFAGLGFLARSKGKVVKGRPNQVILALMKIFFDDKYIFRFADGKQLKEKFLPVFQDITDCLNVIGLNAMKAEGALWETLKRYSDGPWNEFFVDVPHENAIGRPGDTTQAKQLELAGALQPYGQHEAIYLRPTPFDSARWGALYQEDGWGFDFDGSDAIDGGEQLGPNADDVANFTWASPKVMYSRFDFLQVIRKQAGNRVPQIDAKSIGKFGIRVLEKSTEFVQFVDSKLKLFTLAQKASGNTTAVNEAEMVARRTEQLANWFGYDEFWSGTLTTVGRIGASRKTGARIGGIIRNARDGREYYITGISQSWSMGAPWVTTLQLSRGHKPAEFAAWWKARKARVT